MNNTSSQGFLFWFWNSSKFSKQNFWVPYKGLKTSPVHFVFVRKQQRCAACVCALHSIFPVGNWVQGGFILPCSRPGLGSALWNGAGSSSTSPAYWWHFSLSENARLKATASRGLIAEPGLQLLWLTPQPWLLSALQTPLVEHRHSNESYLGVVCSFDEPLLEHLLLHHSSRPPGSTIFIHLLIG